MDKLIRMLKAMQFPFAYDHFAEGEAPPLPYICFLFPESDNFAADGKVYYKKNRVNIELYTEKKDISSEQRVEKALDENNIFYSRSEVWIESEKMYEVLYKLEMEV